MYRTGTKGRQGINTPSSSRADPRTGTRTNPRRQAAEIRSRRRPSPSPLPVAHEPAAPTPLAAPSPQPRRRVPPRARRPDLAAPTPRAAPTSPPRRVLPPPASSLGEPLPSPLPLCAPTRSSQLRRGSPEQLRRGLLTWPVGPPS